MVSLIVNGDGSVNYTGPSGFTATFTKNSDGSFNDAPGIEATLVKREGRPENIAQAVLYFTPSTTIKQ